MEVARSVTIVVKPTIAAGRSSTANASAQNVDARRHGTNSWPITPPR